ncbi:hypothetical protein AB6N24_22925, partial [Cellulomonas sp. 179-A 4D5 NHS]
DRASATMDPMRAVVVEEFGRVPVVREVPVPTRGPGQAAAQPSTAGTGPRSGGAAPRSTGGRGEHVPAPGAGAPHHGSHAAPSEVPAARADAWRRAWGFPEPTDDEQDDGTTNREGQR